MVLPSSSQELEELSLTDHQQQLEMQTAEFEHLCATIEQTRGRLEGLPLWCTEYSNYKNVGKFSVKNKLKHFFTCQSKVD